MSEERVVLVNDNNEEIGTALKSEVHTSDTPLHRAFSLFIFNSEGELLLQQRNLEKKTWPGVWSNSCCGHPGPGEETKYAVSRRVRQELGFNNLDLYEILPNYKYRAELNGVVEHEICPVFVAFTDDKPQANPKEVEEISWIPWRKFLSEIEAGSSYSAWCIEEAQLLNKSNLFNKLLQKHTSITN